MHPITKIVGDEFDKSFQLGNPANVQLKNRKRISLRGKLLSLLNAELNLNWAQFCPTVY